MKWIEEVAKKFIIIPVRCRNCHTCFWLQWLEEDEYGLAKCSECGGTATVY